MSNSSNQFIKNTILRLLGAIGSEKEINKYIEKFSSPEQRFAVIKVGGSVIENDLDNLISSLVFLNQVGLKPVILHGAGPMLSAALEKKKIDFSFINGQRVTSLGVRDVAQAVFKETNTKIVAALEAQGAPSKSLTSDVFQC
jgi:acetylglutamate kinase